MNRRVLFTLVFLAVPSWAASLSDQVIDQMQNAQVVVLGEVHDNPDHHRRQAEAVAAIAPRAVVWEMLTDVQAARFDAALMDDPAKLAAQLDWSASGWPDFAFYHAIFKAAPTARVYGAAVPREAAMAAMRGGIAVAFGLQDAARFGLSIGLPEDEQSAREALQMAAHCDAIPEEMLPQMVSVQRLRDAELARAVVTAIEETGGPVAVITGNGHARRDWGLPVYVERVAPGLSMFVLGQSEAGRIDGEFDIVLDSAAVERPDPCLAFRNDG